MLSLLNFSVYLINNSQCCAFFIHTIGQFCKIPITRKILSRIKYHLAPHWSDIGYELIDEHKVENIESNKDSEDKKCFIMLKTWLEADRNPCYCKLFKALETYKYFNQIKEVKELITS